MKKWKDVLVLVLLGFTIYLCFRNYKLNSYISQLPDSSVIGISDTIKLKEKFKPQKPFSQLIEPSRILLYDFYRNSNRMTKSPSSDSTAVDSDHSVKVSKKDSLVQFTLDNNKLNIEAGLCIALNFSLLARNTRQVEHKLTCTTISFR